MNNLIVFDLDGVITSEAAYWDAAGLTLHELMYSPHYWNIAGGDVGPAHIALQFTAPYQSLTKAAASRSIARAIFPEPEILALKARSINSNWDTTYAAACLRLVDILAQLPVASLSTQLPLRPWDAAWIAAFRELLANERRQHGWEARPFHLLDALDSALFQGYVGLDLINRFDVYASEKLGLPISGVFSRYSPFWEFCRDIFQQWFLGDELYTRTYHLSDRLSAARTQFIPDRLPDAQRRTQFVGSRNKDPVAGRNKSTYSHSPAQPGKPGCIHFEQPLLPLEQIRVTLATLRRQGYTLGIATGRDRQEAIYPLKRYGLLEYFDEQRISTYDDVERAESTLRAHGDQTLLTKPHPFPYLKAAQDLPSPFIVVGDSTSDMLAGHAAGALTVAVLTGARTADARERLAQSNPDFTIADITELPSLLEEIDSLATIQRLQFTERDKAERLLRRWFARHMHLSVERVTLTPKAVSLNSFNGFYRSDAEEFFFKTHVEEQGTIEEYYHAELLHQAGYNIVQPLRTLHEGGQQMVIYPVVRRPVMFDLVRAAETNPPLPTTDYEFEQPKRVILVCHPERSEGSGSSGTEILSEAKDDMTDPGRENSLSASPPEDPPSITPDTLAAIERDECARLLAIYRATLQASTAEEHARAPIHQLFWHRLTGERMKSFYAGKHITLPSGNGSIPFETLLHYPWSINGVPQQHTLGELIERAKSVLHPAREAMTVIGHGDAHFGNVFLQDQRRYLYFDPAFAGRHTPLLDVVKPLFHNIFATWMYFPREVARDLQVSLSINDERICFDHNFILTPVRQAILRAKVEHLLRPLIAELAARAALPADWREIVQLAMLCCALLTVNLADGERFPPAISWLGLSLAVQVGNSGISPWGFEL